MQGGDRRLAAGHVRTWQEWGDDLPPHVVDASGSRWFEPVEFTAKERGLDELLGEPVAAMVPGPRGAAAPRGEG
ncbi:hypothetical protein ACQEVF_49835 [Nonomuraea polychroma]|uniref:hypothetical protein n=1 Tax=Nonomuraea polychroma TaxID=46176 RepID=UPI003D8FE51B